MTLLEDGMQRCEWANSSELMAEYHDNEWGTPLHDDTRLFEFLILETMQAGLSWATILNRREQFRRAFYDFDLENLAGRGDDQVSAWMLDPSIIRNLSKLRAVITNARAFQQIQKEFGSFDRYQWLFVNNVPIVGDYNRVEDLPSKTDLAVAFSADLKKRGFAFIGPTTCYAHMQATGMVDDHIAGCWRRRRT